MKTQKRSKVKAGKAVRAKEQKKEILPFSPWSRLYVLQQAFAKKQIKLGVKQVLATMKIGDKKFADLISSVPKIGRKTMKGLKKVGIDCEVVKANESGSKVEVVIFRKVK